MLCLCIGICQLGSMVEILKASSVFSNIYTEIKYYAVFNINEEKMRQILEEEVPKADLILSQPVSDKYKNNDVFSSRKLRETALKYNKTHYIVSNCYFTGYDPIPFQTTDKVGNIIHFDSISYFPSISLDSILKGNVKEACIKWCDPNVYSKEDLDKNIFKTIEELKTRENKVFENDFEVDIKICDFIVEKYTSVQLFHTYNHPTNVVLTELVRRLMDRLGLPYSEVKLDKELLGDYSIPPPPSVYYKMNMTFEYPKFVIKGKPSNTYQSMNIFIDSLRNVDQDLCNIWRSSYQWGLSKLK